MSDDADNVATPVLVLTPSNRRLRIASGQPMTTAGLVNDFFQEGLHGFGSNAHRCICIRNKEARFLTLVVGLIIIILGVLSNAAGIIFLGILIVLVFIVCQILAARIVHSKDLRLAVMGLGPGGVDGKTVDIMSICQTSADTTTVSETFAAYENVPIFALAVFHEGKDTSTTDTKAQCLPIVSLESVATITATSNNSQRVPPATSLSTRMWNETTTSTQQQDHVVVPVLGSGSESVYIGCGYYDEGEGEGTGGYSSV